MKDKSENGRIRVFMCAFARHLSRVERTHPSFVRRGGRDQLAVDLATHPVRQFDFVSTRPMWRLMHYFA